MSNPEMNSEEKSMAWRKRQMILRQIEMEIYVSPLQRNAVLEEVAREIEKMTAFGPDTIGSFAVYIRSMKK